MKNLKLTTLTFILFLFCNAIGHAQFSGWKQKVLEAGAALGSQKLGLAEVLKKPAAITTSFEDVDRNGSKFPNDITVKNVQPLY